MTAMTAAGCEVGFTARVVADQAEAERTGFTGSLTGLAAGRIVCGTCGRCSRGVRVRRCWGDRPAGRYPGGAGTPRRFLGTGRILGEAEPVPASWRRHYRARPTRQHRQGTSGPNV
jgi:hypothetical protein